MAYIDTKYIGQCETCRHHRSGKCDTWCDCGESYSPNMFKIPSADVEEVKHGEWIDDIFNDGHKICSVCEEYPATDEDGYPIEAFKGYQPRRCPNCGARMDEERRDNIESSDN